MTINERLVEAIIIFKPNDQVKKIHKKRFLVNFTVAARSTG